MYFFRYLSIYLFVCCFVSVAQEVELVPYENKELRLWGYINPTTEEIVIRPKFNEVGEFIGDIAPIKTAKRWGLINRKGQVIVEPTFDELGQFFYSYFSGNDSKLVALVKNGDNIGFIRTNGKMVNEYDNIGSFNRHGLALVSKDGKSGFINQTGKEIIPLVYDDIGSFNRHGLALVSKDGKSGFIDQTGKEIISLPSVIDFFNMIEVNKDRKQNVVDLMGKDLIPLIDHDGNFFFLKVNVGGKKNDYGVIAGGKWGIIDLMGTEITPPVYDEIFPFNQQGLAWVQKNENMGIINLIGTEITPPVYDEIEAFNQKGLALVKKDGKLGLIDAKGKQISPPVYDEIESFNQQGLAIVKKDSKWGVIDTTHKIIIPLLYDQIEFPLLYDQISKQLGLAIVEKDGKRGVIDKVGERIIPIIYDGSIELSTISENLIRVTVQMNEKWSNFVLYIP